MTESELTKILVVSLLLAVQMTTCSCGAAEDGHKQIARAGCQDECGGVKIPFPFGIGDRCYFIADDPHTLNDTYRIVCDNTSSSSNPKPLLPILGNREVLGINLQDHTLRVSSGVAYDCHPTGESVPSAAPNSSYVRNDSFIPMMLSSSRNNFVAIGCGTTAALGESGLGDDFHTVRCTTCCEYGYLVPIDGTCSTIYGFCESPIIRYMSDPFISVRRSFNHTQMDPSLSYPCSYAFVAEVGSYNFSVANLTATAKDCYDVRVPLVYDWFLHLYGTYNNCSEAKAAGYDGLDMLCSTNSMFGCDDVGFQYMYGSSMHTCQCLEGYSGNPYLPNGCQDINECVDEGKNNCEKREYCVNKEGGYDCRCPERHLGNATTASPCTRVPSDAKLIPAEQHHNQIALEGCQDECGGVKIPFPFGIGDGCYAINAYASPNDTYRVVCDNTSSSINPKPLLPSLGNREVLGINVQDHTLRVSSGVAYDCHPTADSIPFAAPNSSYSANDSVGQLIMLSGSRNNFVAIGCGITASLGEFGSAGDFNTDRCTTSCEDVTTLSDDGLCETYLGCCNVHVSRIMSAPFISVGRSSNYTQMGPSLSYPCSYAFVAEVGSYNFSAANLTATAKDCYDVRVPLVYDWFLHLYGTYDNCSEAKAAGYDGLYMLCSTNSMFGCDDVGFQYTYGSSVHTCQCLEGYSGNPYLPNGCQDINECVDEGKNNCEKREYCVNKEGGYDCRCPKRHLGNATTASPCMPVPTDAKLIVGISIAGMGSVICFIALYAMYKLIKRRKGIKERKHNFKRNGGLLLKQEMSTNEGVIDKTKIFSRSELEKATDNFNENRVLGHGGQGTVYKGMLEDGTIIAVKKSKKVSENQLAQFINEVVILSQINHRNIVKLLGVVLRLRFPCSFTSLYPMVHSISISIISWKILK